MILYNMNNNKYQKPVLKPGDRGISILTLDEVFNGIIIGIRDQNIKEVLLKIKFNEGYDQISKVINSFDVQTLRDTVNLLRSYDKGINIPATDELVEPGLFYAILKIVERFLPYNCKGCDKDICKEDTNTNHRCVVCDMGSCKRCVPNTEYCPNFICHRCVEPSI